MDDEGERKTKLQAGKEAVCVTRCRVLMHCMIHIYKQGTRLTYTPSRHIIEVLVPINIAIMFAFYTGLRVSAACISKEKSKKDQKKI